jgi:hypothetical protein
MTPNSSMASYSMLHKRRRSGGAARGVDGVGAAALKAVSFLGEGGAMRMISMPAS